VLLVVVFGNAVMYSLPYYRAGVNTPFAVIAAAVQGLVFCEGESKPIIDI